VLRTVFKRFIGERLTPPIGSDGNMKAPKLSVTEFYEKDASEYDKDRWSTEVGRYIDSVQREIVLKMSDSWAGKQVLDIGTGTGRFAVAIAQKGAMVTATDVSTSMLDVAKAKFAKAGLAGEFIQANITELPFQEGCFEGCICVNVMSHLLEYREGLREISRVLKPGGFVIANFPNVLSYYLPYGLAVNALNRSLRRDVYTHWYRLSRLKKAYTHAGIRIEESQGQVHFPLINSFQGPLKLLVYIDSACRRSFLRYAAPILFVKGIKAQ